MGYESAALVPIRLREKVVGLIHVSDKQPDRISLQMVETPEGMAVELATAIEYARAVETRSRNEDQIRRQNEFLNTVLQSIAQPLYVTNANGGRAL